MDNIKQNLPKIVIGAVGALTLTFVIYKFLNRDTAAAAHGKYSPFTQIID